MSFVSRWLDVETDAEETAALVALPASLALLDLNNDNDYKLLVGDLGKTESVGPKLKTFKGTQQSGELSLPDLPVALVGFYASEASPRTAPVVAVALGPAVYIYKNMKLFYKYYLPTLELNPIEMEVWTQLTSLDDNDEISKVLERLKSIPYNYLTPQSQQILTLDPDRYSEYVRQSRSAPAQKSTEVACMATLKMNSVDKFAVSCLLLGTEDGDLLFLDPQTFSQLHCVKICDTKMTPYQIVATGLFEVDYRITIVTREKTICTVKRDWPEGRCVATLDQHAVSMQVMPGDSNIVLLCMDSTMRCYNKKGKKQWSVQLEHYPITMSLLPLTHLGTVLVGVALRSGHLLIYSGKTLVDTIFVKDVVSAMTFGQLGREEHVLIIITLAGDLQLKILKRTADFNLNSTNVEPGGGGGGPAAASAPHQLNKPWVIPKKSKLFLEQSMRERENAVAMHQTFQRELNLLRLMAARTLVDTHRRSENTIGVGSMEPIRLSAEVSCPGPVFRVVLTLENGSPDAAVSGLALLFHVRTDCYKLSRPYIQVPLLVPGGKLQFPTTVEEVFPEDTISAEVLLRNITGQSTERNAVKLLLLKEGRASPVLAATIQMPPTDPMMLPLDKIQNTANFV